MSKTSKITLVALLIVALLSAAFIYARHTGVAVFTPAGPIAQQEQQLIYTALALSLFVVVPVFVMTFTIAWKYRASNHRATYMPDWDHSRLAETVWWGLPSILIAILSVITWQASHKLDPYKALASTTRPITIQVVALDWKWLFIYPQQHIASVNLVKFPANTPVNFQITADAPMNSFWIPQLGGQIYAMPGMSTQLHLLADKTGVYRGSSANISGEGFAGMHFNAQATTAGDFNNWVKTIKRLAPPLDYRAYNQLADASSNNPVSYYSQTDPSLYDVIVMKFMEPLAGSQNVADSASTAPDRPGIYTQ